MSLDNNVGIELRNTGGGRYGTPHSVSYGEVDKEAERRLRFYMKLFFYNAFKYPKSYTCSFSIANILMFCLQLMKVILITVMMYQFGQDRNDFNSIITRGHTTLRHLLLKDWDASWETPDYPPAHGEFAVYKINDLNEGVYEAAKAYHHIEDLALGHFMKPPSEPMNATLKVFEFGENDTPLRGGAASLKEVTFPIPTTPFDLEEIYDKHNLSKPVTRIFFILELTFSLHSVKVFEGRNDALCLHSHSTLSFKNRDSDGQVVVKLDTKSKQVECTAMNIYARDWEIQPASRGLAQAVLVLCGASVLVTIAWGVFGVCVLRMTKDFMKTNFQSYYKTDGKVESDLPWREYRQFFRVWDFVILFNDVLIVIDTAWLRHHEVLEYDRDQLDAHAVRLSIGVLFAWCSLLRFFNIHHKIGLLFKTITQVISHVTAFLICAAVMFFGFLWCGYVALGPYHVKFRSISSTSETLVSVCTGDEIYSTIHLLELTFRQNALIWMFLRFYLFSCIAIFMFVVINLMMAIVLGAYKAIVKHYEEEENLRDLVPLEKALYKFIEKSQASSFRQSIFELLQNSGSVGGEEQSLREHFRKFCRITEDGRDVVRVKPRTLRAFMAEEDEDRGDCSYKKCHFPCLVTCRCRLERLCVR